MSTHNNCSGIARFSLVVLFLSFTLLSVLCAQSVSAVLGDVLWNDTAEYGTLSTNWYYLSGSGANYNTNYAYNSTKSIWLGSSAIIRHNVTQLTDRYIDAWFYDTGASGTNTLTVGDYTSGNAVNVGVVTGANSTNYVFACPTWTALGVPRSNGWHHFEVWAGNASSVPSVKVDGTSANCTGGTPTYLGIVLRTSAHFDDVRYCEGNACSDYTSIPKFFNLTCSSCEPPGNQSPYIASDTTPTFRFDTNVYANCRIGLTNVNYTTMGVNRTCTSGEGSATGHVCTLNASIDTFPDEDDTLYITCKHAYVGDALWNSTGPLVIMGLASTPEIAIDYGIQGSVIWPQATVYQNQQVFLRDLNNNQKLATIDRVVVYGNQRWLFNYDNSTKIGLFNITPVVYSLELGNLTNLQVQTVVTSFINATKN